MQTPEPTAAAGQPATALCAHERTVSFQYLSAPRPERVCEDCGARLQDDHPGEHAETCLQRALARLAAARDHARGWQLDALHHAVADELAHPAMAGDDPLTHALRRQLECAADEGAQPATTAGAGLTPQQWHALAKCHREGGRGWLAAGAALLAVAAAVFSAWPWGFAS